MFPKGTDCDFCVLLDASYDTFTLRNVVAPYAFVARNQLTSNQPKSRVTQETERDLHAQSWWPILSPFRGFPGSVQDAEV